MRIRITAWNGPQFMRHLTPKPDAWELLGPRALGQGARTKSSNPKFKCNLFKSTYAARLRGRFLPPSEWYSM